MTPAPSRRGGWPLHTWLPWAVLVCVEVLTQLALKFASRKLGVFDFSLQAIYGAIACPWLWVALASYLAGFVAWMTILARSELSRAYPTSAIVFVAVMLVSLLALNEPISIVQGLGAAIIVAGILQLGRADAAETAARVPTESTE